MSNATKLSAALLMLLAAGVVFAWESGRFDKKAGAGIQMQADCPACGATTLTTMDQVIAHGDFSSQFGWSIKCRQCGRLVRIHKVGDVLAPVEVVPSIDASHGNPAP